MPRRCSDPIIGWNEKFSEKRFIVRLLFFRKNRKLDPLESGPNAINYYLKNFSNQLGWIRPIKSRDFFKPLQMVKSSILFFLQYGALVSDHWVALAWTK